ncbi:MAG: methionine adenosyltransferase [Rickettsiales bacterium]|jgi:S-adenosylmethionine synthetase|nr:methionine adenosyltransferase [Rickettsiales bacterium]
MLNNRDNFLFTSESVSSGHPDKICDQISDSILDLYLSHDPNSRVAVECFATPEKIIIGGEVTGPDSVSNELIEQTIRKCIRDIGYEQDKFHWNKVTIENLLIQQSPDIAFGVDAREGKEEGAGDQGIMFGFACDETPCLMPATIYYSHRILQNIFQAIKDGKIAKLGPDAKSQVTLEYVNGVPVRAKSIVVSIQHPEGLDQKKIKGIILPYVEAAFPDSNWFCKDKDFYVNPTGVFTIGGPEGDAGLTGRKIIVDSYGGAAPHGGGAFSGKDPSKVDRSAAYAARYLAKNVVAAGLAKRCTIQLSYAIGLSKPLSFYIHTDHGSKVNEEKLAKVLQELVDLTPAGIKHHLQLTRPIYQKTASFGHFGRSPEVDGSFPWEKTDLVDALKKEFK